MEICSSSDVKDDTSVTQVSVLARVDWEPKRRATVLILLSLENRDLIIKRTVREEDFGDVELAVVGVTVKMDTEQIMFCSRFSFKSNWKLI